MLEEIIDYNPELESFKKEMIFLLDMINLMGLHFISQDNRTEGFLHTCKNEMNDKFLNIDIYSCNDNESIHSIVLLDEEEAVQHIVNVFKKILIDKKYYPIVEAKDIDPLEFELTQKEREECFEAFKEIIHLELVNISKYDDGSIYYQSDLLNEQRLIPDALLYESKLIKELESYYDDLYRESVQPWD